MKKQTLWLLVAGLSLITFQKFTLSILKIPESISDFLVGFGVGLILTVPLIERKIRKNQIKGN
jgi:hypothetical protein